MTVSVPASGGERQEHPQSSPLAPLPNHLSLVEQQALSSRISLLQEITTSINQRLSLAEILRVIGQRAKWLLDFDHCSVALCQPGGYDLSTLFGPSEAETGQQPASRTMIEQAIQARQPQLVRAEAGADAFPSQLIIPLESEGEILGVINFTSRRPQLYNQEDMRIGYLLTMQLAAAIRNARRFEEINRLYTELETTYASLRRAESLRDDLMNMIIHDLRSPLTAIMGNLDLIFLLLNRPNSPETQRCLASAQAAAERMMSMIDDLLNVSRLDGGELKPVLAPLHLYSLLDDQAEEYRAQAERDNKTFIIHASRQDPPILGDAALLGRVIDNLVGNAFKYTDPGGRIELTVERQDQALCLYVRDDGQGIPPEHQRRIFDKFFQVTDSDGAALRKGAGLGLAFCRLAIEAHGGQIGVESTPGQGSVFFFTLPYKV